MPRLSSHTSGKDTLLIFAVSSYLQYLSILFNIIQCFASRASQLFPSIWLSCLAALLAGILIHSSDCPSLCCTAVQERRTVRALYFSLAQVSTQEIATKNLFWDTMSSDTLVFEGKSNSKWWLTFLPTPNPSIVCALEGSQHCHLAVWSIEGTDLILSPLTQHDMQKITWAIANADVKSGKPWQIKKGWTKKNSDYVIEYWHKNEAGILLILEELLWRLYRYKCTRSKIVTKPSFRKRHLTRQNVYPCRKLERTPCLATSAAHAAVKFGHKEQSTNKNKQTVPNKESENVEGLPSKLLLIWPFVKILCMSSESSKSGSFFSVHLLSKQFELHSFRLNITIRSPFRSCRPNRRFWSLLEENCKACTPRTA